MQELVARWKKSAQKITTRWATGCSFCTDHVLLELEAGFLMEDLQQTIVQDENGREVLTECGLRDWVSR